MKLKDKIAVVTGGSQGIGAAICYAYALEGAVVIIVSYSHPELGKQIAENIKQQGGKAEAVSCDVTDNGLIEDLVKYITNKYHTIDILVHSAGVIVFKEFEEQTVADWDYVMNVNLKGPFFLSQAVVPQMKQQRYGKIIFISSLAGLKGNKMRIPYGASKGGILAMSKAMVAELAPYNINVNCILPGNVETSINLYRRNDSEYVKALAQKTPSGQAYMKPKEIAAAAVFLASADSNSIHGLELIIDNGLYAV